MKHHSLPIKMTLPFPGFHHGLGALLDSTCITPQNPARRTLQNHFTEEKPRPKATRASDEQGGGSRPIALTVSAAASCRGLGTLEPDLSLLHSGHACPMRGGASRMPGSAVSEDGTREWELPLPNTWIPSEFVGLSMCAVR